MWVYAAPDIQEEVQAWSPWARQQQAGAELGGLRQHGARGWRCANVHQSCGRHDDLFRLSTRRNRLHGDRQPQSTPILQTSCMVARQLTGKVAE